MRPARNVLVGVAALLFLFSFLAISPKIPDAGLGSANVDADSSLLGHVSLVGAALTSLVAATGQAVREHRAGAAAILLAACCSRYLTLSPFIW